MVVVTCLSGSTDVYLHADMDGKHTVVPPIGTACESMWQERDPAPAGAEECGAGDRVESASRSLL